MLKNIQKGVKKGCILITKTALSFNKNIKIIDKSMVYIPTAHS